MKVNNENNWLQPALDVIAQTAPDTYADMQATDWDITVVSTGDDMTPTFEALLKECSAWEAFGLTQTTVDHLNSAYGVTIAITDESPKGIKAPPKALQNQTYLNRHELEDGARELGVPLPKMIADTVVHEFTHREGFGENKAYANGATFANAMGEPKLAETQVSTGEEVRLKKVLEDLFRPYDWE